MAEWSKTLIEKYGYNAAKEIMESTITATATAVIYILCFALALMFALKAIKASKDANAKRTIVFLVLTIVFSTLGGIVTAIYIAITWPKDSENERQLKQKLFNSEAEKIDIIEADLKQHLETDGFDTEPRPFTQDDMRKWEVRTQRR